ncbi:sporulation initiation factor Spo0A C-terminal domain-containing protein [Anaerosporobacter sp.]|uniref:sporulation initiation factor Spo0A C-terminal domain-containing protein n=1 Tax=Anaerosporobacter sp. TaxID=1872529 RepID=UPI00286F2D6B|nr:sporulation initiation factor Spo0A C-terminal domain-containing protein [Anaerosporobacter sp.]
MSELRTKAMNALLEMGVNPKIKGFKYTLDAIELIEKDETILNSMVKGLYTQVAENNKTTTSRVERAIRHMMMTVTSSSKIIEKYVSASGDKITNSKFISSLYYNLAKSNSTDLVKQVETIKPEGDACIFCGCSKTIISHQGNEVCEECAKKIAIKLIEM